MAELKTILWDAERLALFSNVNDLEQGKRFGKTHENFFPRNFWNWLIPPVETGAPILTTGYVESLSRLRQAPPIEFWKGFQKVLRDAWQSGFPLEECVRLISSAAIGDRLFGESDAEPDLSSYPVWPYQRAVMFLGTEQWRARFCGQCGTRFVADKPARRFCSNNCSTRARRNSRAVSWSKHGGKWRSAYKTKKAKAGSSRRTKR